MKDIKDFENRIICGDCLEIMGDLPDKSIDLIIADPPYNIGKDTWDKIENYETWLMKSIKEWQRVLKDNGSLYWFHSEMELIADIMTRMRTDTNFIFRQFIVWNKRFFNSKNKGFLDGYVVVEDLRNYQQMAEYILYYTFQDETGLSKVMGSCVYPIREYLRSEIIRAKGKIVLGDINRMLGTADNGGGVASACLSVDKYCPAMITEEHYLKLRNWLNEGKEYEYLRKEYEDLRFTFNNQKTHHSVWNYDISESEGHITPKPICLIENIVKHSSKENAVVLDPFMGWGTTALACKKLNRRFIGIEINPDYCKSAGQRIANIPSRLDSYGSDAPRLGKPEGIHGDAKR
jgi:site-specific DNA-methyltransferase (adenine-specific)